MAYDELRRELDSLEKLLSDVNEASWARNMSARLADGSADPSEILYAFGGMGSLNDLLLHTANGHAVEDDAVDATNDRLRVARSRIYELSTAR